MQQIPVLVELQEDKKRESEPAIREESEEVWNHEHSLDGEIEDEEENRRRDPLPAKLVYVKLHFASFAHPTPRFPLRIESFSCFFCNPARTQSSLSRRLVFQSFRPRSQKKPRSTDAAILVDFAVNRCQKRSGLLSLLDSDAQSTSEILPNLSTCILCAAPSNF